MLVDEEIDSPSTVRPRATDFLSASVEARARAASAIVGGEDVKAAVQNPFKVPLAPKAAPTMAMEGDDEAGLRLRATRGQVQPIAKADLMPPVQLSAEQAAIVARIAPPGASRAAARPEPENEPESEPEEERAPPSGARRPRSVEMPEPGERGRGRREFKAADWDRYYNPGIFERARIPQMPIERGFSSPDAPAWTLVGKPKGMGVVTTSQAPYRASLQQGARTKDARPQKEVAKFVRERGAQGARELDLEGADEVPEEEAPAASNPEETRRSEFEAAMADLERSFEESRSPPGEAPRAAAPPPRPAAPARAAPAAPLAMPSAVSKAAERAMPFPQTATSGPPRPALARSSRDLADEDESEIVAEDEEEPTLGRAPPHDHRAEDAAHRTLQHDGSGAALCPTCGRRINPQNQVLVCTSCSRVACATCGKFSAGAVSGNVYQYEYRFNFPLCQPCFDRHFNIQKNIARGRAYLASGNLTYAFYHAQSARQLEEESSYKADVESLLKQVEQRRSQNQRAEKEWDEARRKLMKDRTTVLK